MTRNTFPVKIRNFLYKKKIKQTDILRATGIPVSALSNFINGWKQLPPKHVSKFCEFLGIEEVAFNKERIKQRENI